MAKGSHKTWGGWETRVCFACQERITLHRHTAAHHYDHVLGVAFSLCGEHGHLYGSVRALLYRQAADAAQMTLDDVL
jgi:hypothetical protein